MQTKPSEAGKTAHGERKRCKDHLGMKEECGSQPFKKILLCGINSRRSGCRALGPVN